MEHLPPPYIWQEHCIIFLFHIQINFGHNHDKQKNARWRIHTTAQNSNIYTAKLFLYDILGFPQIDTTFLKLWHQRVYIFRRYTKRHRCICFLYIFYICHIQHLFQSISLVHTTIHEQKLLSSIFAFTQTNYISQAPPPQSSTNSSTATFATGTILPPFGSV